MARLAVPVNLPEPPQPLRSLAKEFTPINHGGIGVNVICSVCKQRGRVNSMLIGKGKRPPFVCGACREN